MAKEKKLIKVSSRPKGPSPNSSAVAAALGVSNLDDSQKGFCAEREKAVRLLAPAGCGKTRSLLWRCLAQAQAASEGEITRFLVFTFTRAARDELRDRLKHDPQLRAVRSVVDVTTLNSWGFRYLKNRMHNPRLVTTSQDRYFTMTNLLQPVWQGHTKVKEAMTDNHRKQRAARQLMDLMDIIKGLGYRHDLHREYNAYEKHTEWLATHGMGKHVVSMLKQLDDLEIVDLQASKPAPVRQAFNNFHGFWCDAITRMYESAMLTLEDQKYWACIDLENAAAGRRFTTGMHRYHHILVDEFQDINTLDLNLLKAIAAVNRCDLTIVGDDDQAIYEWRGATPEFILTPDKHISPGYVSHILEVNYRSPRNVVELSQRLIKHNKRRVHKSVVPVSMSNAQIEVLLMPTLEESVEYCRTLVKQLLEDENIQNIALIGRKRSQIIPYQIVFASDDVPFYAAEDLHVLLSDAFDDLKQMLLLKAKADQPLPFGPDPVESLLKICDKVKRYPLNKSDRGKLKAHLLAARPRTLKDAVEHLYTYTGPLKGENVGGAMARIFYVAVRTVLAAKSVADSIRAISQHFEGLQKDYGKSLDDVFYTDPPFLYLSEYAERYGEDFAAFYQDIEKAIATLARIPPAEDDEQVEDDSWKRPLHLMTALRAKGKEFDAVILLDVNAGIWPSKLAETEEDLEAERRLFYVAFTRARKRITLLVDERVLGEHMAPSPYIQEMGLSIQGLD
ncbi:MAG: ATP-dependent helicase [Candidatus Sumerlaeaceae bacterium]|nr:ATP-dependent helicase [Candidatus Sumerlaeaceae bacterium]